MIGRRIGIQGMRAASLALTMLLGGCASFVSGVYGSAETGEAPPPTAQPYVGKTIVQFDPDAECPQITVPAGTSSYAGGTDQTAIRYQGVLSQYARECILNPGNDVTIKVGVEGRILLGERGGAGTYSAPVRIAVRNRAGQIVYSQVHRVTVSIPPGETLGTFKFVDESAHVAIAPDSPLAAYDILVGFGGDAGAPPRKKRRG